MGRKKIEFEQRVQDVRAIIIHLVIAQLRKSYKTLDQAVSAKYSVGDAQLKYRRDCGVNHDVLRRLGTFGSTHCLDKLVSAAGIEYHKGFTRKYKSGKSYKSRSWFNLTDEQMRGCWDEYANTRSQVFTKAQHEWLDRHVYKYVKTKKENEKMNKDPVWMGGVEKHAVPPLKIDIKPQAHPADDIPERNEWDELPEPLTADELRAKARDEMKKLYQAGMMGPSWADAWKGILQATVMPKPVREFDPQSRYWSEYRQFVQSLIDWVKAGHEPDNKKTLAGTGMTETQMIWFTRQSYVEAIR